MENPIPPLGYRNSLSSLINCTTMTKRRPFLNQLRIAWDASVLKHYRTRQINSERTLQASLWANLIAELPANRRTFIERQIRSCDGKLHFARDGRSLSPKNANSAIANCVFHVAFGAQDCHCCCKRSVSRLERQATPARGRAKDVRWTPINYCCLRRKHLTK